ncbi:MAG: hypothetical protein GXP31_17100 [Kiritimatiellaeota bacterium]|nr:hypothetical protein [Kiritimatiellota bacterium]
MLPCYKEWVAAWLAAGALVGAVQGGADQVVWRFPQGEVRFAPQTRQVTVRLGAIAFQPLVGAGPTRVGSGGRILPPKQEIRLQEMERLPDGRLYCVYESTVAEKTARFAVEVQVATDNTGDGTSTIVLHLRWHADSADWEGVWPGFVTGLPRHTPLFFYRSAEAYGGQSGPATYFCKTTKGPIWLFAEWDVSHSSLNGFRKMTLPKAGEVNPNFPVILSAEPRKGGAGPFSIAGETVYQPDTTGRRLTLDDVLVVRVADRLWNAVPTPAQPPSPYRDELARSVYVDCWGQQHASKWEHWLNLLGQVTRGRIRLYTILQNWQAGGFDALLPDSVRMPDLPPNASVGTVAELRHLCQTGRKYGRFGFRTNYIYPKSRSPSVKAGEAKRAKTPSGKDRAFIRPRDLIKLAFRQEPEIKDLFDPNCTFSDQLGSAGAAGAYIDFEARWGTHSLRETWACLKTLCEYLRQTHGGPLSSETLNSGYLIGGWLDTGDYGLFEGHTRSLAPDYKLRKLQQLSVMHGVGLGYRFFFAPPYGGTDKIPRGSALYAAPGPAQDDYRACEVLFGNGAYLYLTPVSRWRQMLSEVVQIGALQRRYALTTVTQIAYRNPKTGSWGTLEELIRAGVNVTPVRWIPQPEELLCARVRYSNGLEVVVNRAKSAIEIQCSRFRLTLPRYGWAAWMPDGRTVAFSAYWPGTTHRVDYLEDKEWGWRFLDPRGRTVDGVSRPTLFENGRAVVELIEDTEKGDLLRIDGREHPGSPPGPPPPTRIDFRFERRLEGWQAARDLAPFEIRNGVLYMVTRGGDPFTVSPPLNVEGDTVREIAIRMRTRENGIGQLFWASTVAPLTEKSSVRFNVVGDGKFHEYRLVVGNHPLWKGHIIRTLRIDPLSHDAETVVEISSVQGLPP